MGSLSGYASGEGKADLTGAASAAPIMFATFNRLGGLNGIDAGGVALGCCRRAPGPVG